VDLPHATIIMAIEVADGKMKLSRARSRVVSSISSVRCPACSSIQSGINKVRSPTLKGIMAAKKKEIGADDA